MKVNMDLHIHSKYSTAASRDMDLPVIAREARRKGVAIVGTGDCLFPQWIDAIKALPEDNGLFTLDGTHFALTAEVEDEKRVHHLIFLPDLSKIEDLRKAFATHSSNLDTDGRPKLHMNGAEIADVVLEAEGLIGPSHAFTPWTGIFAHYRSLAECYQENADKINFIELGLSADTNYADRIKELTNRTFLSNSDAHSPRSNKLAREFNQMEMREISCTDLYMAIRRVDGRHPTLNVGFYPEEGKYNQTACTRCYRQYDKKRMDELSGRCPSCGGLIKLGVKDRVEFLADYPTPMHPEHRPPYLHLIPLTEIIAMALGQKSPYALGVQKRWRELTEVQTEIDVLVAANLADLKAEAKIIEAIAAFRCGEVVVRPGGGGKYGELALLETGVVLKPFLSDEKQKSLFDF